MAATSESPHLPALGVRVRGQIGRELDAMLLELIDLTLLGKQLHWSVQGPQFVPLHQRLDELVASWRQLADTVAERAIAIGYWPDGQAEAVAAGPEHTAVTRGPIEEEAAISLVTQSLVELVERTRVRLVRLGELDLVSRDLVTGVLGTLERQLRISRAQLALGNCAPHPKETR